MTTFLRANRTLLLPLTSLILASMASCAILVAKRLLLGPASHLFLVWNLFLAWLPVVFALAACWAGSEGANRRWTYRFAAAGWFLFFPNAPYILTDIIHLGPRFHRNYWPDLVLILLFALTGLVLGFVSLFLMQRQLAQRHGWLVGWCFAGLMTLLGGFGIYVGRFLRWNSWDVLFAPHVLMEDAFKWLAGVPANPRTLLLPLLFGIMLLISYVVLYALTHLQREPTRILPALGQESI